MGDTQEVVKVTPNCEVNEQVNTPTSTEAETEQTLTVALNEAEKAFEIPRNPQEVLKIVDIGISVGKQNEDKLTHQARHAMAHLHRLRSQCLFTMTKFLKSVQEMDEAIICAQNPDTVLLGAAEVSFVGFCVWLEDNLILVEWHVMSYLRSKKKKMMQLSKVPSATAGTRLLAGQCCRLAHKIWSLNDCLISLDEMVDLLVIHAGLCADCSMWSLAEQNILDAFGLGGSSLELYRMAIRVNVHNIVTGDLPDRKKRAECHETLAYLSKALELAPEDVDLLSVKSTVDEVIINLPSSEKTEWTMESEDWCNEMVNITRRQQEQQRQAAERHKANHASKSKTKVKKVMRKGTAEAVDDSVTDTARTHDILLEMSVGRGSEATTAEQNQHHRKQSKKPLALEPRMEMRFLKNSVPDGQTKKINKEEGMQGF
jgi:hypothetical protein